MIGEQFKILLCISFWETRKIPAPLGLFFPFYNLSCTMRAQYFRNQLKRLQARSKINAKY